MLSLELTDDVHHTCKEEKRIKQVFSLDVVFSTAKNLNGPVLDEIFLVRLDWDKNILCKWKRSGIYSTFMGTVLLRRYVGYSCV